MAYSITDTFKMKREIIIFRSYSVALKTHIFPKCKMRNTITMRKFSIPSYSDMR